MIALLSVLLSAVCIAAAVFFFVKWQAAEKRVQEASLELRQQESVSSLADKFKLLSQETLDRQEDKSSKEIASLLQPVRDEVLQFRNKVEEYLKESRSTKDVLEEKFKRMDTSIDGMVGEARDLTEALKGNSKTRGDWGEVLLKKALEGAGLREGETFDLQSTFEISGRRFRPDAVLQLPGDRHIVIDSKVSMLAYDEYVKADDEQQRKDALKKMQKVMEEQVEEVARYNSLPDLNTPGFSIMYAPIEPAWELAMSSLPGLVDKSQKLGVLILGPVNLMVALRMVEHLWMMERQHKNISEIAQRGAKLQDSVIRLVERVDDAGRQLDSVAKTVGNIRTSIHGKQGVLFHADKLASLGIKGKKSLPEYDDDSIIEAASENQDSPDSAALDDDSKPQ